MSRDGEAEPRYVMAELLKRRKDTQSFSHRYRILPLFTASYGILPHFTAFYRLGGRYPIVERITVG